MYEDEQALASNRAAGGVGGVAGLRDEHACAD
jgi:hypothetical protein